MTAGRSWALTALVLGALFAGASTLFVRLSDLGPVASAFYRPFLALPVLWLAMRFQPWPSGPPTGGPVALGRRVYAGLFLAGLFFAGDLFCWHQSIVHTAVANAALLATLSPIYVAVALFVLFGERTTPALVAGTALAITGAALILGDSVAFRPERLLGDLFGLATGPFFAGYLITVGRLRARARIPTATVMFWTSLATAAVLLPLAWAVDGDLVAKSAAGWGALLALALVSHVGGQGLIAYAMAHLPTAFTSVALILEVVAAAVLGWLFLGEALAPLQMLGAVVVVSGIVVARRGGRGRSST